MRFLTLAFLFLAPLANATDFTGSWVVVEVVTNDEYPSHMEIKYPETFELHLKDSTLVGSYIDQWGYECDFDLVETVNDDQELLLMHCGGTKSPMAWAPIHKVKMIDGKLHGIVITSEKQFTWIAEKRASE